MQFHSNYTTQSLLSALSSRLGIVAKRDSTYRDHTDSGIKAENLKYNISLTIAHLLLEVDFNDRSPAALQGMIETYNTRNNSALTIENFIIKGLLRLVNDEVRIPALVKAAIKDQVVPGDRHLTGFLREYREIIAVSYSRPWLTAAQLESLLKLHAHHEITTKFLIDNGILAKGPDSRNYYLQDSDYLRYLRQEIAATLWITIADEEPTAEQFRKFYKIISHAPLSIDNLKAYLSQSTLESICDLAIAHLRNEPDLVDSGDEFAKVWLDMHNSHFRLDQTVPAAAFDHASASALILGIEQLEFSFGYGLFDYQQARSPYYVLLRFIAENDLRAHEPCQRLQALLKDATRPYIPNTLYNEILTEFPQAIPYLMLDSDLIALAFKKLPKLELKADADSGREAQDELKGKLLTELYLSHFDLALDLLVSSAEDKKTIAEVIIAVLISLSERVFKGNYLNTGNRIFQGHNKILYEQVLDRLADKKERQSNSTSIYPSFISTILPELYAALKEGAAYSKVRIDQFVRFSAGYLDLSITLLKFCQNASDNETVDKSNAKVRKVSKKLTKTITEKLTELYTATDVQVTDRFSGVVKKRPVERGVNEFGFEIIDWGFLLMQIFGQGLFDEFHATVRASFVIDRNATSSDKKNREEYNKIRIYLKSLLLGFLSITKKREMYSLEGKPLKPALGALEAAISEIAIKYSRDETAQGRIDIFNERHNLTGNDIYFQFLTPLLFNSLNNFGRQKALQMVNDFFQGSSDLGRMLTAVNIVESPELKKLVNDKIEAVPVEDFINNAHTVTELQYTLVEAVNSKKHWKIAKPLIDKIHDHFTKRPFYDENVKNFLFEIDLVLAYKENDKAKLVDMTLPLQSPYHVNGTLHANMKAFYTALYMLNHDKDYNLAVSEFEKLAAMEPQNVRYAFYLYRSQTLKAINTEE